MKKFHGQVKAAIKHLKENDKKLAKLIEQSGEYTVAPKKNFCVYESLVESITHQQLHGKAAETIFRRFKELFPHEKFPSPESVIKASLKKLRSAGLSEAKANSIKDLAKKTIEGIIPTAKQISKMGDEEIIERLIQVKGIGKWTVQMILIFQLGRLNVFPIDDFGVRHGFSITYKKQPDKKELIKKLKDWHPYCSIASWYMWRAVDIKKTKQNTSL